MITFSSDDTFQPSKTSLYLPLPTYVVKRNITNMLMLCVARLSKCAATQVCRAAEGQDNKTFFKE
jgi:hypothetical protein